MAEIKISELSIGDWVNQKMNNGAYQVQWIEREMVGLIKHTGTEEDGSICLTAVPLSFIEPIPLTPEILEKNGLCVVEEDADFSEYELFGSENFSIFHIKGTLHYRLETPQASVVCWNVHQLQHALRLAGVEKEIEV